MGRTDFFFFFDENTFRYAFPAGNYMFKVTSRTRCKICSKLTIKTPERWRQRCRFGFFIVNFEHILHLVLVFLLLTLS